MEEGKSIRGSRKRTDTHQLIYQQMDRDERKLTCLHKE